MSKFAAGVAAAICGLVVAMTAAQADDDARRAITVVGTGEVTAVPDTATFSTGVVTQGRTAKAAIAANSREMANVVDGLKAVGIAAKDIATSTFSVFPQYAARKNGPREITGFEARNTVTVIIRDIATVGDVLDRVASLGANQFGGLSFSVSDADKRLDAARADAIADARRKAELYAAPAGAKLGAVLSIDEHTGQAVPRPVYASRAAVAEAAPPIESGEQTLRVSVTVRWALEDD